MRLNAALLGGILLLDETSAFHGPVRVPGVQQTQRFGPLVSRPARPAGNYGGVRLQMVTDEAKKSTDLRTGVFAGVWEAFLGYALLVGTGLTEEAKNLDNDLLLKCINTPTDVNHVFALLFFSLGLIPAIYGALLLPGSKDQKPLPAVPFVFGSFAGGFFAVGPYLALRQFRPSVDPSSLGPLGKAFNNPWLGRGILLGALGLAAATAICTAAGDWDFPGYVALLKSSFLVRVSSIDFCILSLLVWEPIREDMMRRGWFSSDGEATSAEVQRLVLFSALPVLGPAAYLALRPELTPSSEE